MKTGLIFGALVAVLAGDVAIADTERPKTQLDPDECLAAFSSIANSERLTYRREYPQLYSLRTHEAATLLQHDSVWIYVELAEGDPKKALMDDMGFRTKGLRFHICEVRNPEHEADYCLIGLVREDRDISEAQDGLLATFEFIGGNSCDALLD